MENLIYTAYIELQSADSLPKWLQWLGLDQAEAECHHGLPCGQQGLRYLGHILLPPLECIEGTTWKVEQPGLELALP